MIGIYLEAPMVTAYTTIAHWASQHILLMFGLSNDLTTGAAWGVATKTRRLGKVSQ